MSNEQKPLTAEEWAHIFTKKEFGAYRDEDAEKLFLFAGQTVVEQTAALREELDKKDLICKNMSVQRELLQESAQDWRESYNKIKHEIESLKAERDKANNQFDSKMMELMIHHEKQLSEVTRQRDEAAAQLLAAKVERDEAVAHLDKMIGHANGMVKKYRTVEYSKRARKEVNDAIEFLSRMSSGERKAENATAIEGPGVWSYPLFKHMSDEHRMILTESELFDIVDIVRKMEGETKSHLKLMCDACNGHGYFIKFGTNETPSCEKCKGTGELQTDKTE